MKTTCCVVRPGGNRDRGALQVQLSIFMACPKTIVIDILLEKAYIHIQRYLGCRTQHVRIYIMYHAKPVNLMSNKCKVGDRLPCLSSACVRLGSHIEVVNDRIWHLGGIVEAWVYKWCIYLYKIILAYNSRSCALILFRETLLILGTNLEALITLIVISSGGSLLIHSFHVFDF